MPAPFTDDPPSAWTVLNDFSKTIITLSTALFALSATFSANLIGKTTSTYQVVILLVSWSALALSIAASVASQGFLINYLQDGRNRTAAVFCANASFDLMAGAVLLFVFFGMVTFRDGASQPKDVLSNIDRAREVARQTAGLQMSDLTMESAEWESKSQSFQYLFTSGDRDKKYRVIIEPGGRIVKAAQEPAGPGPSGNDSAGPTQRKFGVIDAQQRLTELGYAPGPADGILGKRTNNAIQRFQVDRSLPRSGILDGVTTSALQRKTGGEKPSD